MKAIVTGATGHIGNVLVRLLLNKGFKVRALTLPGEPLDSLKGLDIEIIKGDIRNKDDLSQAFQGFDLVFHLAGIISILPGYKKILDEINVIGTRNIVQACQEIGIKRLIFTSSIHAIVEPPKGCFIDEVCDINPENTVGDYAKSKAQATLEVKKGIQNGLEAVIVFPTGVIGPYDFRISEMGHLILDYLKGKVKFYIDGAYDFVDVRDVAEGLYMAAIEGTNGEGYILSGHQVTVKEMFDLLEEITKIKSPDLKIPMVVARVLAPFAVLWYLITKSKPRFTPYSLFTLCSNSLVNCNKAKEAFGYQPRPIKETLRDTVSWFYETGKAVNKKVKLVRIG
ncbi:MAG: 3 beta-hydroxysteroid dehydrogenase/Delta 5--_4-isomerase [candidate division WS2 bacterium]|uniref:3 beta-hydroxysteroid dehydrogenase/Delta 5-->4-isomerase n=1 Tax=Psychracetigena formicireducens TaxID=2986056 RepID=A0A9E2BF47_PSYF1|nr:3 beta-hydroxysteroid dehydrogenase/Delta 5-->4-isomerase [Candidatus Psychracetigena formicireducens]MBT9144466.1 3 beta-hydroxysteroid dehydrogenase/Delta 5-->4-isomerase [Candidatus Psychracetigena formicireducens]